MMQIICLVVIVIATLGFGFVILRDGKITKAEMEMAEKWLNFMIVEAEELYGKNAGKAKLFFVYSKFVERFPKIAKVFTIEKISDYVDLCKKSEAWKEIARKAGIEVE